MTLTTTLTAVAVDESFGHRAFDNTVRLFVIFVGITLALMCVRFAYLSLRRKGERFRVFGILSFAFIVATPAITGLFRFDAPINWWSTTSYLIGLVLGLIALYSNYYVAPAWWRMGRGYRARVAVEDQEQADWEQGEHDAGR